MVTEAYTNNAHKRVFFSSVHQELAQVINPRLVISGRFGWLVAIRTTTSDNKRIPLALAEFFLIWKFSSGDVEGAHLQHLFLVVVETRNRLESFLELTGKHGFISSESFKRAFSRLTRDKHGNRNSMRDASGVHSFNLSHGRAGFAKDQKIFPDD